MRCLANALLVLHLLISCACSLVLMYAEYPVSPWYSALRSSFSQSFLVPLNETLLGWCCVSPFSSPPCVEVKIVLLPQYYPVAKLVFINLCLSDVLAISMILTFTCNHFPSSLIFSASSPLGVVGTNITVSCGLYHASLFIDFLFIRSAAHHSLGL